MRLCHAVWGAALLPAIFSTLLFSQGQTSDLRSRFEHEANAVQKAKLMPALGDAEFSEIRKDVEADQFSDGLALARQYRDQVQSCVKGLDNIKIDVEKHPSGFKQLQISLQESLRRLDALLHNMTSEEQAPFLDIRKDLDEMNRHLIEELFPRRMPEPAKTPET